MGDLQAMEEAVAQQPVSIAIEADQMSFQLYHGGVLTAKCGTKLDHGVLVVGYGTLNGTDYWKVKNSWGAGWDLEGYILLEKGKNSAGECGIKMQPSYPVASGKPGPSSGPSPGSSPPSPPSPPPSPSGSCCYSSDDSCSSGQTCCSGSGNSYESKSTCAQYGAKHHCEWDGSTCKVGDNIIAV